MDFGPEILGWRGYFLAHPDFKIYPLPPDVSGSNGFLKVNYIYFL
jgi:hypothetical protein